MRFFIFILCLFALVSFSSAENESNFESFLEDFSSEKNQDVKVNLINQYIKEASALIPDIAILKLNELAEKINKNNFPSQYIRINQEIAIQQNLAGDDEAALNILFELLEFTDTDELDKYKIKIFTDIGWVHYFKDDCENALVYFKKSYQKKLSYNDSTDLGGSFSNIGTCFSKIGKLDSAEYYILKAKETYLSNQDSLKLAKVYNNLGNFYLRNKSDVNLAEFNFNNALAIYSAYNDKRNEFITVANLGNLKIRKGEKKEGELFLKEALYMAKTISFPALKRYTLKSLTDFYESEKQFDSAYYYQNQLYEFNDSLKVADQQKAIEELEAKYKFKEQTQNLAIKDLKINQLIVLSILMFLILIILFLLLLYFRQKKIVKEELEKAKSDFFSKIAHEFKTPLSLVIAPLEEMLEQPEQRISKEKIALATKNAYQVSHLINQLLDVAKLEEGKMTLVNSYGDMVSFVQEIVDNYKLLAQEKEVQVQFNSTIADVFFKFDSDKLKKAIENILSNAIKYTKANSAVEVNLEIEDDKINIHIKDQGNGLSKEEIQYIFDKFYRTKTTEDKKVAGTGLGLSLAKDLVELQGGTIHVKSVIGNGSTFTISIPLNTANEFNLETAINKTSNEEIEILIVEDNNSIRNYLNEIFTSLNIKTYEARHGKEGLQIATKQVPDIIISDLMMPEMNGIEMVKILKNQEITSHIPIIMLTAKSSIESRLEGLKAEADVYLAKPFVVKELLSHVQNFITLREKIKQQLLSQSQNEEENSNHLLDFKDSFIQKIIEIILQQLDNDDLSIEDISNLLHLSRTQVHRKVKQTTGLSTSVLVRNIRLEKALEFLKNKEGNVSQIAYKTGFNSASYFSTCFTDYFGFSPTKLL